jgi:Holliday junction DNA helicase RuvA
MIDYISGTVAEKRPTFVVIENGGIGFGLSISTNTYKDLPPVGDQVRLKTYLHVREDILHLYAFSEENERSVFTGLISVSGIGPKLAQTILSGLKLTELAVAIQQGDIAKLTSISGVGTKTAQRLVVELREKISQLGILPVTVRTGEVVTVLTSLEEEAMLALLSLGYKKPNVEKALSKVRVSGNLETVEDMIKMALQVI